MIWVERWARQGLQVEQRPLQGALALAPQVRRWARVAVPPVEQMPLAEPWEAQRAPEPIAALRGAQLRSKLLQLDLSRCRLMEDRAAPHPQTKRQYPELSK